MPPETLAPEAALAIIETLTPADIFKPGAIDPILDKIEAEVRATAATLDISTPNSRSALASLAYKVGRSKTFIDGQRKSLVSDEKKRLAKIDAEGKRIWERLEALQEETRKPLTEWENADKERIANLERDIQETETCGNMAMQTWHNYTAEAIRDRMKEIEADSQNYQEFTARFAGVRAVALKQLAEALEVREEYDRQQVELARLRAEAKEREQKEREERLVSEATEKAERAKVEAEAREKAAAERHEAEMKAQAEKAEADRLQAVKDEQARVERERNHEAYLADVREKDKEHLKNVNSNALAAFVKAGLHHEAAKLAVSAIVKGEIPNVRLVY